MPRRRVRWLAAVALAVVAVPTAAQAQLFPNLPIRRERTPCVAEPPVFALYRHEYFGYHPTCWRPFPLGWGCPSPEAPDTRQAITEVQEEIRRREQQEAEQPQEGATTPEGTPAPAPEGTPAPEGEMPALPPTRSPFPLDREAPGTPRTRESAPPPADLGAPPVTPPANVTPPRNPGTAPPPPAATPPEASTGPARNRNVALLDVGRGSEPESVPAPADAMPAPPTPAAADPGAGQSYLPYSGSPTQPVLAPQRRGLLGGLIQRFNWTRR